MLASIKQGASGIQVNPRTFTVGDGGSYATLFAAAAAAAASSPSATNWATIIILPGTHEITANITFPRYCSVIGIDRDACILTCTSSSGKLIYNKNNRFANFTYNYASTTTGTNYLFDNNTLTGTDSGTTLDFDNLNINFNNVVSGSIGGCFRLYGNRYVRFNNCELSSTKRVISTITCNTVHINNCDLWLLNANVGTSHIAIDQSNYARIQMRGGKIATGYGPFDWPVNGGIENEQDQHIYGVLMGSGLTTSSRLEMYNVWCIVRNETGANAGIDTINICSKGAGHARIFGGYYQAEDGGASEGNKFDFSNESTGIFQLIGEVSWKRGNGRIDGMSGSNGGVRTISTNTTLTEDSNCTLIMDTSAGSVTASLPPDPSMNQTYRVKRPSALNVATLNGNGKNINGAATLVLPAVAYEGAVIQYIGTEWLAWAG